MPKSRKPRRKASRKTSRKGKKCPPGCVKKTLKRSRKSLKSSRRRVSRKASRKRRSVKRKASRKRRSVKRKASRKRRSVKRKASRKRRSVKRKASRKYKSVKRKVSRKRRSVKRKASRKRRSVKRKASRKRRSVKASRKRRSVKRKASRKRRSVKRKASRKRRSVKRKASRKRKSAKKSHKFRLYNPFGAIRDWNRTRRADAGFEKNLKAQRKEKGRRFREDLLTVIGRLHKGLPQKTYMEVAELFIEGAHGLSSSQRDTLLAKLKAGQKIPLSPDYARRYYGSRFTKEQYQKANNRRIAAVWKYYFKTKHKESDTGLSRDAFISSHKEELRDQKKKERCLHLQGIVSQTQNESIKAHGVKEMQELGCSEMDKQFRKQLVRVSGQTKLRSAAKQLKADPKKVQQMREQFQKYNKICAKYGGYYGMKEVNGRKIPVCKGGGKVKDPRFGSVYGSDGKLTTITYPKMPLDVAEKLLQKDTAHITKLQALARKKLVRKKIGDVKTAAERQRQIQVWDNTPIKQKVDKCEEYMETIGQGGKGEKLQQFNDAMRHFKTHKCKDVKKRYRQVLVKTEGMGQDKVAEILAKTR